MAELRAELHTARGKLAEQEEQLANHGSQTGKLQAQVESLQGRCEGIESEQARTEDRLFEAGCREDKLSNDVRMLCCRISNLVIVLCKLDHSQYNLKVSLRCGTTCIS